MRLLAIGFIALFAFGAATAQATTIMPVPPPPVACPQPLPANLDKACDLPAQPDCPPWVTPRRLPPCSDIIPDPLDEPCVWASKGGPGVDNCPSPTPMPCGDLYGEARPGCPPIVPTPSPPPVPRPTPRVHPPLREPVHKVPVIILTDNLSSDCIVTIRPKSAVITCPRPKPRRSPTKPCTVQIAKTTLVQNSLCKK